jgi:hypothetical protein
VTPPHHREFARRVEAARLQDPKPAFENLSRETGIPVDQLIHYALVRWTAAGSEALMSLDPQALRELAEARGREDWPAVAGIIDWLLANENGPPEGGP